jgi:hypothetical protein
VEVFYSNGVGLIAVLLLLRFLLELQESSGVATVADSDYFVESVFVSALNVSLNEFPGLGISLELIHEVLGVDAVHDSLDRLALKSGLVVPLHYHVFLPNHLVRTEDLEQQSLDSTLKAHGIGDLILATFVPDEVWQEVVFFIGVGLDDIVGHILGVLDDLELALFDDVDPGRRRVLGKHYLVLVEGHLIEGLHGSHYLSRRPVLHNPKVPEEIHFTLKFALLNPPQHLLVVLSVDGGEEAPGERGDGGCSFLVIDQRQLSEVLAWR